jgi:hypothetical protein
MGEIFVEDFTKEFRQLCRAYDKVLKDNHATDFKNLTNPMNYLVSYLKFMRDYYILTEPLVLDSGEENLKIAALATAVSEYEQYQNCIHKYYSFNGTQVIYKTGCTSEEVQQQYNKEKTFHWNNFWNLIRLNMEDWMPHA